MELYLAQMAFVLETGEILRLDMGPELLKVPSMHKTYLTR